MNRTKRRRLKAKGWRVGSTKSFLRIPRKLKKKYKKVSPSYKYIMLLMRGMF